MNKKIAGKRRLRNRSSEDLFTCTFPTFGGFPFASESLRLRMGTVCFFGSTKLNTFREDDVEGPRVGAIETGTEVVTVVELALDGEVVLSAQPNLYS